MQTFFFFLNPRFYLDERKEIKTPLFPYRVLGMLKEGEHNIGVEKAYFVSKTLFPNVGRTRIIYRRQIMKLQYYQLDPYFYDSNNCSWCYMFYLFIM